MVNDLSNWYKKSSATWKRIPCTPFSAIFHCHSRILLSARKQRTKKALNLTSCAPGDPAKCVLIDIYMTISIVVGTGCNFPHG